MFLSSKYSALNAIAIQRSNSVMMTASEIQGIEQNKTTNIHLATTLTPIQSLPNVDSTSTRSQRVMSGYVLVVFILALLLAQFLSALDITIIATALPTIANQVHVTGGEYTWVGSSYNLASTASTPLWAKCSDIWGRKPIILLSNATFMAGSLIAGLANSSTMLIAGRTLQGAGGGGIVIMVSIIIADLFPLQERAKYYGLSSIVWAVASAMGPVLGGVFTQTIGWRWCCKLTNLRLSSPAS
jgi:MFS family permease